MSGERPTTRELLLGGLHLAVLWSFGVAKPLFDVLTDEPAFFVSRGNDSLDIILFTLFLLIVPPAIMLAIEAIAYRVKPQVGRGLHLAFIVGLVAIIVMQILNDGEGLPGGAPLLIGLAIGAGIAYAYLKTEFVRSILTVLGPAPALFGFLFLVTSPVADLVLPQGTPEDAKASVGKNPPVVFFLYDEFPLASLLDRSEQIDESRYPNFARLAKQSSWYRNTTTVGSQTPSAVPAILTGKAPPDSDTPPTFSEHPRNLFTFLDEDYEMNATETVTNVCPDGICGGSRQRDPLGTRMNDLIRDLSYVSGRQILPKRYAEELPEVNQAFDHFHGYKEVVDDVLEYEDFIERIGPGPTLNYFHVQVPHNPWQFVPDGRYYEPGFYPSRFLKPPSQTAWVENNDWIVKSFWQRHLLQTGFADTMLGQLIDKLEDEGIWEEAVVIVAADHGAGFYPGEQRRTATKDNSGAIVPVPLFVKASGQTKGEVVNERVCTTQILALLGKELEMDPAPPEGEACPEGRVTVIGHPEQPELDTTLADVQRRFRALVAEQNRIFDGPGFGPVYAWGPFAELVGQNISGFEKAPDKGGELVLGIHPVPYDPDAEAAQVLNSGNAPGVKPEQSIAVADGKGKIVAIGRTYELGGSTRFTVVVPPDSQADGPLQAFRVVKGGGKPQLEPLSGPQAP